jgi:hypothetical protein
VVSFTHRPLYPGTHWIEGWVDHRAGLDNAEKRMLLTLPGTELRPLGRPTRSQSSYQLQYPGSYVTYRIRLYLSSESTCQHSDSSAIPLRFSVVLLYHHTNCKYCVSTEIRQHDCRSTLRSTWEKSIAIYKTNTSVRITEFFGLCPPSNSVRSKEYGFSETCSVPILR